MHTLLMLYNLLQFVKCNAKTPVLLVYCSICWMSVIEIMTLEKVSLELILLSKISKAE